MTARDSGFHAQDPEEALSTLGVDREQGLSDEDASRRLVEHGHNELRESTKRSPLAILADQFRSLVIVILAAAAILAFLFGQLVEGAAIVAVLLVNTIIGFVSEWRAVRSVEALREMRQPRTRLRRGGEEMEVAVELVAPGDIVLLERGDVVPADLRVIEAEGLRVNEAALTGESVTAPKSSKTVERDSPLAERSCMLFKGTTVVEGSAEAVAVATGMETELGHISEMTEETEAAATPLEKRLDRLGSRLAWLALATAGAIGALGLATGQPTLVMVQTALALGVAAVPEGLPIVSTLALAKGMWLMAQRNVVIKKLSAVETLGATTVIFSDKTGTLTQNRMSVVRILTAGDTIELDRGAPDTLEGHAALRRALEIGVLCSNAELGEAGSEPSGDPTEVALLRAGERFGLTRAALLDEMPEMREVSFDPESMMMATYHGLDDGLAVVVKGAPERVLEACEGIADETAEAEKELSDEVREEWLGRARELAEEGFRLIALADKRVAEKDDAPYESLRFVGLSILADPLREDARDAIYECRRAGIRVIMVTGDKLETARSIARELGILREEEDSEHRVVSGHEIAERGDDVFDAAVFARLHPEQKLELVDAFQRKGEVVAMTGDGVNDTPALKKADIGVAMGQRGTEAARQVADMVLEDDALSSVVAAVKHGRITFDNIRKAVVFMLCTNVAEVTAVGIAAIAGFPLPLRALQILYLNVITDVFPAIALSVGPGERGVMERDPRPPGESVITRAHWRWICVLGGAIALSVLGGLGAGLVVLDLAEARAVTISFLVIAFAKLWFVFNLRSPESNIVNNDIVRNRWIWSAIAVCIVVLLGAVYLPGISDVLHTVAPDARGWATVGLLSFLPLLVGQAILLRR